MRYIDWFQDGSVAVCDLALACCALEVDAARSHDARMIDAPPPGAKVVLTVSGTLSTAIQPRVEQVMNAHPQATIVAFGACACSGGPYWDSYAITRGLPQAHYFVPGCPPPPSAVWDVMERVRDA